MRILVLGDSSSSGIGSGKAVYPFKLYLRLKERAGVRLENHAVPGFTSADAARYYAEAVEGDWDYLIVYLGNNEGSQSEYKGVYRTVWSRRLFDRRRRPQLQRVQDKDPFTFVDNDGDSSGFATTPDDFYHNLSAMADVAARRGSRLILVNPIANPSFPSGLGSITAPFFKILGLHSDFGIRLRAIDDDTALLVASIRAHDANDPVTAVSGYRRLADARPTVSQIARNNLAVLLHEAGERDESMQTLRTLVNESEPASVVAAFNLARGLRWLGRSGEADEYLLLAAEQDRSLYRVKRGYRQAIQAMASHPSVDVVDLEGLLYPGDFADYCHPLERGHERIARAIEDRIRVSSRGTELDGDCSYSCRFPSPDAVHGTRSTLLDYYAIDPVTSIDGIQKESGKLIKKVRAAGVRELPCDQPWPDPESDLQHNILHTWRHAAGHPLITHVDDLVKFTPRYRCEVGTFPEYYIYGILWSYLSDAENAMWWPEVIARHHLDQWELSADTYRDRVLSQESTDPHPLDRSIGYLQRIMSKVRVTLAHSDAFCRDVRGERTATVMHWYTREAFRYGTHSRLSMFYPRWQMEHVAEALCVCLSIARAQEDETSEAEAGAILDWLAKLRQVHDEHAERFVSTEYETRSDDAYDRDLQQLRRERPPC